MRIRGMCFALCCFGLPGVASVANATLIDNGDGTVTDGRGLMWLQSPDMDRSWNDAVAWADNLVFAGYDDWRLPSAIGFNTSVVDSGPNSTNNEFGYLYGTELGGTAMASNPGSIAPLLDYDELRFWTGTGAVNIAYVFLWTLDAVWQIQSFDDASDEWHVTAVRDVSSTPQCDSGGVYPDCIQSIPEPGSIVLVSLGLAGFAVGRRRRRFVMTS